MELFIVTIWCCKVWTPSLISFKTLSSTKIDNCSSVSCKLSFAFSVINSCLIFCLLMSTNGAKCDKVNDWPLLYNIGIYFII